MSICLYLAPVVIAFMSDDVATLGAGLGLDYNESRDLLLKMAMFCSS